jgi:hypothetical protein
MEGEVEEIKHLIMHLLVCQDAILVAEDCLICFIVS